MWVLPGSGQAVGGGEEGTPSNPPQLPSGTASRPACLDGRRCQSNSLPVRDRQGRSSYGGEGVRRPAAAMLCNSES